MPSPEGALRSRQSSRDSPGAHRNRGTHRKSKQESSRKHRKSHHRRKHTKQDQEVVAPPKPLVEYDDVSSNSSFFDEPVREKSFERRPSPELPLDRRHSIHRPDARLPAEINRLRKKSKKKNRQKTRARSGGGAHASRSRESFARGEDFGKDRIASTSKDSSYLNHVRPPPDYAYSANVYEQPSAKTRQKKRGRTPETPRAYRNRSPSPLKNTQNRTHHSRKRSSDKRSSRPKFVSKSPSPYTRNASAWSASRSRSKTPNR